MTDNEKKRNRKISTKYKPKRYLGYCQISMMELSARKFNYFHKKFHYKCFAVS